MNGQLPTVLIFSAPSDALLARSRGAKEGALDALDEGRVHRDQPLARPFTGLLIARLQRRPRRFRAEETRTVADQMTHEEARTIMRRIALDYDRLAKLDHGLVWTLCQPDDRCHKRYRHIRCAKRPRGKGARHGSFPAHLNLGAIRQISRSAGSG